MISNIKKWRIPIIMGVLLVLLEVIAPAMAGRSTKVMWDYFKEMALIMPPVFMLMGLMEVWIPKDKIQKWLGSGSGMRGTFIAIALGSLPTGPLYVAFPMTASLLRKGASVTNMVIFLGSWAALKVPQLMVEIKFIGLPFSVMRFVLTLVALVVMGAAMEFILKKSSALDWLPSSADDIEK